MKNIRKIKVVDIFQELQQHTHPIYDITINTHGDIVLYYQSSFPKHNAITYCHFPTAKYFIKSENTTYLRETLT